MRDLLINALVAGIFFGLWPQFMRRSGLGGNAASAIFAAGVFALVVPYVMWRRGGSLSGVDWTMAAAAIVCASIGLVVFNGVVAKATYENINPLLVTVFVTQIAIQALYEVYVKGTLTKTRGLGFASAILAAILLLIKN